MTPRRRADRLLVARGLFESRARAQAAIAAGRGAADGVPVRKPSEEISTAAAIEAEPGASLCVARRRQACGGARSFSSRRRRPRLPRRRRLDRRLYRSAAASAARGASMRSTSAAASCTLGCAAAPRSCRLEQTDIRTLDPARLAEPPDFADGRCELHLAQAGAAGDRQAHARAAQRSWR